MSLLFKSSLLVLFLLLCFTPMAFGSESLQQHDQEEFTEELLLKPLPDRKVLAHFHFENRANRTKSFGRHHRLFPKSISQLVQKYHVKEMELSFTQGRWNYERWGGFDPISSSNAKPPGVELWAIFDVPPDQIDAFWKNLTHSLSGLFCASMNFLESSTSYSAPDWAFRPASGNLRYGTLPREAVCTENLTPWLKLLPCRDKAGISLLMDRPSIYKGFYHSQRLRLRSDKSNFDGINSLVTLEQTLTVVLQPNNQRYTLDHSHGTKLQPSWSISSVFGRKISGHCVLARSSTVYLQLDRGLVEVLKHREKENHEQGHKSIVGDNYPSNSTLEISVKSDRLFKEANRLPSGSSSLLYEYLIGKHTDSKPFDLGLTWKVPVVWSCSKPPLHASRFLMGSGNERGAIAISLTSPAFTDGLKDGSNFEDRCMLDVNVFQVVPWYIKVYYHTLKVFIDGQPQAIANVTKKMRVSPSEDKVSPGVMELDLKLSCKVKSATLTMEFDKGFLHIDEYPPDANQGFDIPSAIITFPNFHISTKFEQNSSSSKSSLLPRFEEENSVLSYTEILLVPLTTPDFSMPYNVITITCTVYALYFGSLLNVLRRRVSEEERLRKSRAAKSGRLSQIISKLSAKLRGHPVQQPQPSESSSSLSSSKLILKIILVAGIAVAWLYLNQ